MWATMMRMVVDNYETPRHRVHAIHFTGSKSDVIIYNIPHLWAAVILLNCGRSRFCRRPVSCDIDGSKAFSPAILLRKRKI